MNGTSRKQAARHEPGGLLGEITRLPPEHLRELRRHARRLVQDDGVAHGAPGTAQERSWQIDPIPVILGEAEWARLERGMQQRGEVLRLLLEDVYGPQRLLREGVIPPAAVLGHPGYLRAARGMPDPGAQLLLWACDVGQDEHGAWSVLADWTQAPSGAGYAAVTRRIVSRLLPRAHRESGQGSPLGFFQEASAALAQAAPQPERVPRIVLLSPGASSQTAFDQAFTASLLGISVVEADDLVVREGRPWLRSARGPVPVDVVVRHVHERWSDPLELRGESRVGVPGLLASARGGQAAIVNPVGAGVLENAALASRFAEITRALTGEEPILPVAPSWWCGDDAERSHVLARLEFLLIEPASREPGRQPIAGWQLSTSQRERLRARIEAEPWAWSAHAPRNLATSPVVTNAGLTQRACSLRLFAARREGETLLMRGGLGRVAVAEQGNAPPSERGLIAKDVWVLGGEPGRARYAPGGGGHARAGGELFEVTPRSADNLYWFGRYAERAEHATRLLAVVADTAARHAVLPGTPGAAALTALAAAHPSLRAFPGPEAGHEAMLEAIRESLLDVRRPGSVAASARRLAQAARLVQDLLSADVWPLLAALERGLAQAAADRERAAGNDAQQREGHEPLSRFDELLGSLLAIQGVTAHGMFRDASWALIDAGMRMERAQATVALLSATLGSMVSPVIEHVLCEAVLLACDSAISHRRRAALARGPAAQLEVALELLLADRANPRSAGFQLRRIGGDLRLIGDEELAARSERAADRLSWLDLARAAQEPARLGEELAPLGQELRGLSDELEARHFRRQAPHEAMQARWWPDGRRSV